MTCLGRARMFQKNSRKFKFEIARAVVRRGECGKEKEVMGGEGCSSKREQLRKCNLEKGEFREGGSMLVLHILHN